MLNVFEVVVSTLEGKLQRIDNLDKAVEHLMRRVEQLDNRVADNLHKTDSVISKLHNLADKISIETNEDGLGPANSRYRPMCSTHVWCSSIKRSATSIPNWKV